MIAYVYTLWFVSNFIHLSSPTVLGGPTCMPKNLRMLMSIKNTIWACNGWQAVVVLFLLSLRTHLHCLQWQLLSALVGKVYKLEAVIPNPSLQNFSCVCCNDINCRCKDIQFFFFFFLNLCVAWLRLNIAMGCVLQFKYLEHNRIQQSEIVRKYLRFLN